MSSVSCICERSIFCVALTTRTNSGFDDGSVIDYNMGRLAHKIDPSHVAAHGEARRSSVASQSDVRRSSVASQSDVRRSSVSAQGDGRSDHVADDLSSVPVMHVRPKGAHVGSSIVALCAPMMSPKPDMLVSCSRDKNIAVWSSLNEYHTYVGHSAGARYPSCACYFVQLFSALTRVHPFVHTVVSPPSPPLPSVEIGRERYYFTISRLALSLDASRMLMREVSLR